MYTYVNTYTYRHTHTSGRHTHTSGKPLSDSHDEALLSLLFSQSQLTLQHYENRSQLAYRF